MIESNNKVTYTALMISPPKDQWEQIQQIRKEYDSAYDRWMPHINICFPFIAPENFESFIQRMTPLLQKVQPFDVCFEKMEFFTHAKKYLLFANPSPGADGILEVYQTIKSQYPQLNDAEVKGNGEFHPHLTLGQFKKNNQFEKTFKAFNDNWKPINFKCDCVNIIQRDQKTPFEVKHVIKLGQPQQKNEPN